MDNPRHRGWYSRGYLPHFDAAHLVQAITFRLADSLPVEKLQEWESRLRELSASGPGTPGSEALRRKIQNYLDTGSGACHLRDERIALLVQNALLHFDGERYRLLEWVVMPNHVHVIIETSEGRPLPGILHSWKSFTANEANRILGLDGEFWEPEYYDRYVRNDTHYFVAVRYLRENPVKAGLCSRPEEWRFSSAYENSK